MSFSIKSNIEEDTFGLDILSLGQGGGGEGDGGGGGGEGDGGGGGEGDIGGKASVANR